ncbi:MAG: UDP-N-acetylmuramate--L-alanine ligase [Bacteroidetes bacterium]|nr:UDP-N-acetylmuramate--L-alanine ligase [Bacteroidota bacterium]
MIKSNPHNKTRIFMVGIKGAGMSALAVLLKKSGFTIYGSDSPEYFITQKKLISHTISWVESDDKHLITSKYSSLIYSSAYSRKTHPQIIEALALGIPVFTYNEYIGKISKETKTCCCVAGTHGKTTTSALIDFLLSELDIPAYSIFGAQKVHKQENDCKENYETGIIEACEYRKHFLLLNPEIIIITNIEFDHPDTYENLNEVYKAFTEFALRLPLNGYLLYFANDPGAKKVALKVSELRIDVRVIPYGGDKTELFSIKQKNLGKGKSEFMLSCSTEILTIKVPGEHTITNAAGAVAAAAAIWSYRKSATLQEAIPHVIKAAKIHLPRFSGCDRRGEIIGEAQNIIIMDDYAHHPTEIITTLSGIREFFPGRKVVADFMPHTYSRTKALFEDFSKAFSDAETVLIHPIFSSAREPQEIGGITGKDLADAIPNAIYVKDNEEASTVAQTLLQSGDLFITMGAGSNRRTAELLLARLEDL